MAIARLRLNGWLALLCLPLVLLAACDTGPGKPAFKAIDLSLIHI